MKKYPLIFLLVSLCYTSLAQVGVSNSELSLEDNQMFGIIWEPVGLVSYAETNGTGIYGLTIFIKNSDDYLDIDIGHKVSIEYTDGTREVLTIQGTSSHYYTKVISNSVVGIYRRSALIYPDFNNLRSKDIQRIVIQRTNGKIWTINTTSRRAKKLKKEFAKAMQEAYSSYMTKVANNNYFNEN